MKKCLKFIFLLLVIINFLFCSNENDFINDNEFLINLNNQPKIVKDCPPCEIERLDSVSLISESYKWHDFKKGELLKINNLTNLNYGKSEIIGQNYWNIRSWWMQDDLDPWSQFPYWGSKYVQPFHNFGACVDDSLRYLCGYSYVVEVPSDYTQEKKYPLIIFLHGGISVDSYYSFIGRDNTRNSFYEFENDKYIIAAPIKLEIDWEPDKIIDVIYNITLNLNVDKSRIYLTGLSMGGRGTFIVAAKYPKKFAAIMPLSPHHEPFSYIPLFKQLKNIPVWMSHGDIDRISSYKMAKIMADSLKKINPNVKFVTKKNTGHWGWNNIYSDSTNISWLMSWKKK